ncbi:peptide-binding protein [Reichenbachiella agariperforans]|nr:peptide-binding protein [Reichenbachiella agariperforans]
MKTFIYYLTLWALVALLWSCSETGRTIYVNPEGQAMGTGSAADPYNSIEKALLVAELYMEEEGVQDITIHIQAGIYRLTQPIVLSAAQSGLNIIGAGSDQVSIKGSVLLDLKWETYQGKIQVAPIPEGADFDQFYANGRGQILARYPNYDEEGGDWQGHAADAIAPERIRTWSHPEGAYFHAMHRGRWGGFHYQIAGVDSTGQAILEGGHQNNRPSAPHDQYRMVENVFEELDSPGEWFLDRESKKLYYWPEQGLDMASATFEGAVLENLISLQGSEEKPVTDIRISGIKFEHTRRTFMNEYEQLLRSDWSIFRGAAFFIEGAENCEVRACEFTQLGGNVIFVSGYNRQIDIAENHIHECGASAICFVGEASAVRSPSFRYGQFVPVAEMDTIKGPQSNEYPKNCTAENNLVYRIGRLEKQSAGVEIAMAMDITVRHNSIYDVPRAGINIGDGTWGGHVLEYNDVFNTVLETGDHGSFNSWGRDRFWHPNRRYMDSLTMTNRAMTGWDAIHTTIIRNNRFRCDHGWDIDLDDGSSNYHIYNNLCLNGGIKLREGFDRVVENNVMVNNGMHPHVWFANSEDVIRQNIAMKAHQDVSQRGWGKEIDQNFFTNEDALQLSLSKGLDSASRFGDPLFVDPASLDYRVEEGSPALAVGFENFPMDQFGVQVPALKSLAETPEVPDVDMASQQAVVNSVLWRGMKLKSIETMAEQSATGLPEIAGVMVLKIMDRQAQPLRLKPEDVILEVDGVKIKTVDDFLSLDWERLDKEKAALVVMRNQSERKYRMK